MVDYRRHVEVRDTRTRREMGLAIFLQIYIASWAQFPDHSHPLLLASRKLSEQMQLQERSLNGRGVFQGKLYQDDKDDIR
jgi:hypothetical protein